MPSRGARNAVFSYGLMGGTGLGLVLAIVAFIVVTGPLGFDGFFGVLAVFLVLLVSAFIQEKRKVEAAWRRQQDLAQRVKECPHCRFEIPSNAPVCGHCRRNV